MSTPSARRRLGRTDVKPKDLPAIKFWDVWALAEEDAQDAMKRCWDALPEEREFALAAYAAARAREEVAADALQAILRLSCGSAEARAF
jgi:hypothetical protein